MAQQAIALSAYSSCRSEPDGMVPGCKMVAPGWMEDPRPSLLIISKKDEPSWQANTALSDVRLVGVVPYCEAYERLTRLADVDAILLDIDHAHAQRNVLAALATFIEETDAALLVVQPAIVEEHMAPAKWGALREQPVRWLCDTTPATLRDALKLAFDRRHDHYALHDSNGEHDNEQLQQLSDEVDRLSRTINALRFPDDKTGEEPQRRQNHGLSDDRRGWLTGRATLFGEDDRSLTAAKVRDLLRARRLRDEIFGAELFADPAWDMILDLMAARLSGERVSVSSLCIAASVPATTALRWIKHLTQRGVFERRPDTEDGRRVFIALSDKTASAVHRWYAASVSTRREGQE